MHYKDYASFLAEHFQGKVQKLTVNAGFSCPNRDGTVGYGGCSYCNNASFSPQQGCGSVVSQLESGKKFFARKYPRMQYLAYFQSYTNTHAPTDTLVPLYEAALGVDGVVGLIIATRPDCMSDALLEALSSINRRKPVIIEYGAESSHDTTLQRVNRCHTWSQTVDAVMRTKRVGLTVGLHLILGLPGETTYMMLETIDRVSQLPVDCVKLHQLQIIRSTRLALEYEAAPDTIHLFDVDEYIALCGKIISRLRADIAIERFVSQSPDGLLIAPKWGLKNYEFTNLLNRHLSRL